MNTGYRRFPAARGKDGAMVYALNLVEAKLGKSNLENPRVS